MGSHKNHMIDIQDRGFGDIDKYICSECVEDRYLKDWILENYTDECECDYCHQIHRVVNMEDLLDNVIMPAVRHYYSLAAENLRWDGENKEYWGNTYTTEEVIDDFELEISSNPGVINNIKSAIIDYTWCKRDPYGATERDIYEYSWEHFSNLVKYNNRYFFSSIDTNQYDETLAPIDILYVISQEAKSLGLIRALPPMSDFYRARKYEANDDKIYDGGNLGSPPSKKAKVDRMSAAGISTFYAADNPVTSLKEICVDYINDENTVIVGKFNNLRELTYLDLTMVNNIDFPSVFDLDKYEKREAILFFRKLNAKLTMPINKLKDIEYIPTQIFAEYFKQEVKVDGIKYESSKDKNGNCYVLFFTNEQCIDQENLHPWQKPCELKLSEFRMAKSAIEYSFASINTETRVLEDTITF